MNDKELDYTEEEIAELQKTINVLEAQNEELKKQKLSSTADKFAIDYISSLDEHDLSYLGTHEVFDNYLKYRRKFTENGEAFLSVRMLNNVIKSFFPNARINHSNKNRKNVYFWVFENNGS